MSWTVPIQFLRATVEGVSTRGFDVRAALASAGLNWGLYGNDRTRVLPEQITRVTQALWEQADDELLGLGPRPVPRGMLRMIGLTVIHAPDLRTALSRITEYGAIAGFRTTMSETGGVVRVETWGSDSETLDPMVTFAMMAAVHRFAAWLTQRPFELIALEFPFRAEHLADDYRAIFGVTPRFGAARASLSFDARHLTEPVTRTEADLREFLRDAPGSLMYQPGDQQTVAGQVRNILQRNPTGVWLSADEVAARLSVSPPHLRRLLRADGTSFRRIQEDILRDLAVDALARGDESITNLAERLGYSDARAFRRAFRRWTGSAPADYRATPGDD